MRARWLARLLRPRLQAMAAGREPDFQVTRDGGREVYLRRWWIVPRNRFLNVYLHNMLKDDDPILHDHPYSSLSLVLTDGLFEIYCPHPERHRSYVFDEETGNCDRVEYAKLARRVSAGQLVWRSSRMAHQLIVESEAWTLFVTGPRVRDWGFWCPRGFRRWQDYVAVNQDPSVRGNGVGTGTSTRGVGCGEMS